jgi:hypothetical protein
MAYTKTERKCADCKLPQSPWDHCLCYTDILWCVYLSLYKSINVSVKLKSTSASATTMKRKKCKSISN